MEKKKKANMDKGAVPVVGTAGRGEKGRCERVLVHVTREEEDLGAHCPTNKASLLLLLHQ